LGGNFSSIASACDIVADPIHLTSGRFCWMIESGMDAEQTITEIESLERIFTLPDTRPMTPSDLSAANRRHDEMLAHSPWFRLWQRYGLCCR
jgi:hypothetical protein